MVVFPSSATDLLHSLGQIPEDPGYGWSRVIESLGWCVSSLEEMQLMFTG